MNAKFIFLTLAACLANSVCSRVRDDTDEEKFVPTKDWREIKDGQKVPSGLHYRINLSTGKKEAKLIDNDDSEEMSKTFILKNANELEEIESEDILKNINKIDKDTQRFRTIDEIKKELSDLQLRPKTDVELLKELFLRFEKDKRKKASDDDVLSALEDLRYIAHQIDNADEFCKLDGFNKIIYPELNSSDPNIRRSTLVLLSSLAQNSPKVKVHVLETGGLAVLVRILSLESDPRVRSSALTALSCTLRMFPFAQNRFFEIAGFNVLKDLLRTSSIKDQLKIHTLLYDFIIERRVDTSNFENHLVFDVETELVKLDWCNSLNVTLGQLIKVDKNDFDSIEKCLLAMQAVISKCRDSYTRDYFVYLKNYYMSLENEYDNEDYLKDLQSLLSNIIDVIDSKR